MTKIKPFCLITVFLIIYNECFTNDVIDEKRREENKLAILFFFFFEQNKLANQRG